MSDDTDPVPDGGWIADELEVLRDNTASLIRVAERLLLAHLEQQGDQPEERHLRRVK
jgi:hypothetical protein